MGKECRPAVWHRLPTIYRAPLGRETKKDASTAVLDAYKTLRKRWLWVVGFTLLALIAAGFYTAGQQRIYSTSCTLQIDPTPPKPLGSEVQAIVDVGTGSFWATTNYYNTQFKIIRSRAVAEETVRCLRSRTRARPGST